MERPLGPPSRGHLWMRRPSWGCGGPRRTAFVGTAPACVAPRGMARRPGSARRRGGSASRTQRPDRGNDARRHVLRCRNRGFSDALVRTRPSPTSRSGMRRPRSARRLSGRRASGGDDTALTGPPGPLWTRRRRREVRLRRRYPGRGGCAARPPGTERQHAGYSTARGPQLGTRHRAPTKRSRERSAEGSMRHRSAGHGSARLGGPRQG
jgi:hypothetical protein